MEVHRDVVLDAQFVHRSIRLQVGAVGFLGEGFHGVDGGCGLADDRVVVGVEWHQYTGSTMALVAAIFRVVSGYGLM